MHRKIAFGGYWFVDAYKLHEKCAFRQLDIIESFMNYFSFK